MDLRTPNLFYVYLVTDCPNILDCLRNCHRTAMKISRLLSSTLLPLCCLAAKRTAGGSFEDWHARSQSSAPLRLDDASYEELTATPRNHSVVVLLTALEARFGCQLCRDFQPEWDLLTKSWARGDKQGETRTLLGTLDFADGKATFQKVFQTLYQPLSIAKCKAIAHVANRSHISLIPSNHWTKRETRWATSSIRFHCGVCATDNFLTKSDHFRLIALNLRNKSRPGSLDICLKALNLPYVDH